MRLHLQVRWNLEWEDECAEASSIAPTCQYVSRLLSRSSSTPLPGLAEVTDHTRAQGRARRHLSTSTAGAFEVPRGDDCHLMPSQSFRGTSTNARASPQHCGERKLGTL